MVKNTAGQKIGAQVNSASDGSAFTSTVTCYVCLDAGTMAIGTVGSGVCAHEGGGYHTYAPSQAETNGDLLAYQFRGTGAITALVQERGSVIATVLGTPVTSVSADIAAAKADTAAIKLKTDNLPADPADASDVASQITAALTAAIADTTPADGSRPSIASGILMLVRFLLERHVFGTTVTVRKEDGATTAYTLTLDSASGPTSVTRES